MADNYIKTASLIFDQALLWAGTGNISRPAI